ncbi:RluA family pseudouridine synthase [Schleiferia thermophila]|jgi:23S rRNA pseudouridine1911/1915/1917 synthase|uniref:23S rRNA pseudouridine1911/1915/1917 synthase n=1 Tax=Schleiferia thermophila TaxID=884107 RepID=A0A368ZZG7_9FLAO|nr:RluA family pseudouridine synthase [Schleiferia thermophila]KFD38170.1 ribosomal large subunit pseudouridine synthase D [Schleiferia thermophila str. Yellowstone]PMB38153.1 RNA pseudouridine synthase [Fischerella thermalis CCMEE 5319]RCX02309.1 23S rRNA pseudouridine1911/1915/1917 synthase [Schleiferia thermophila]GCD80805.1 RNA pseudouridine synthase [Schleiferia thermophila]
MKTNNTDPFPSDLPNRIRYEDNHLIILDKLHGELVQGDKTGDTCLADFVKNYLKITKNKPGNVFLGVTHRLDRPTSGLVIFTKTSKALARINQMFKDRKVTKIYRALVEGSLPPGVEITLQNYLSKNEKTNKSAVVEANHPSAKPAKLILQTVEEYRNYSLVEIQLFTGRHHQIRCQLAHIGHPVKGDVKYGARRPNRDGSISLLAYKLLFPHPITKLQIHVTSEQPLHL